MTARAFKIAAVLALVVAGCARPVHETSLARGKRLLDEGKWEAAIESLTDSIIKDPLDAEAHLFRGRAYHCRGREHLALAIADFNEAIRLNPKNCEAYYSRAEAYKEKGDRDKAMADSLRARRLDPNYASASNMYSNSSSDEAFRRVLERTQLPESSLPTAAETSKDSLLEEIVGTPSNTRSKPSKSESPAETAMRERETTTPKRESVAIEHVRDAYGLPIAPERSGSITEELFGGGGKEIRKDRGLSGRLPSWGPLGNRAAPDWQSSAPPLSGPPLDSRPPHTATKPSPVGTLPYGNPYQPQGPSNYSPIGPRATGLQGDPTLRQSPSRYYDPRYDRNVPRARDYEYQAAPPPLR